MPLPPSHDLRNAVLGSVALHLVVGIIGYVAMDHAPGGRGSPSLVDVELAPAAPKAERLPDEIAAARQQELPAPDEATAAPPEKPDEATAGELTPDAAPDARVDARSRRRADANELVATAEDAAPAVADDAATAVAAVTTPGDAATQLATTPGVLGDAAPGTGSGTGSGTPGAIATGEPAIAGEPGTGGPVSAGTAANLLAYAPSGHVVTALVRLDRLRGTTWQAPVVKLFEPMPDYNVMIGARKLDIADLFETLVISSPEPRNAIATTLVARTKLTRAKLRDLLDEPETPVTWSAARGGMLGTRKPGARVPRGDKRLFLSPYQGWIVLAQPRDLGGLTAPATAKAMDRAVATAPVPPWIDKVRRIEGETGAPTGPVAIVTVAGTQPRYTFSDPGIGISSLPAPERMTVSLEIVKQGFIVRGNLKFTREADAIELVESITKARQRAIDSTILRGLLARSRVLNAVKGLTLDRRGARVSYATSLAIKDAEGLLAVAAQTLRAYFEAAKAEP